MEFWLKKYWINQNGKSIVVKLIALNGKESSFDREDQIFLG